MQNIRRKTGLIGEEQAVAFLEKQGIRIQKRNYRCKYGEIDIIAFDGKRLLIIEVKKRGSAEKGYPGEAVDWRKQKKICLTFDYYRMKHQLDDYVPVRFDVIEVDWNDQCQWIQNAFEYIGDD